MDIILHIGAHRTTTTSFQHYLKRNKAALARRGIDIWTPPMTREGVLAGLYSPANGPLAQKHLRQTQARIGAAVGKVEDRGMRRLLVSEENMSGTPRHNRRNGALYPAMPGRVQRAAEAFGQGVRRVALSIRPQDEYWTSLLTFSVLRGDPVPEADELARLAGRGHAWRDRITALAGALPGVAICVFPFEDYAGRPDLRLARMIGPGAPALPMPPVRSRIRHNVSPELPELRALAGKRGADVTRLPAGDGRWCPFSLQQLCALREIYRGDLAWLRAGADGLATLIEETGPAKPGGSPAAIQMTRGHPHGNDERPLA